MIDGSQKKVGCYLACRKLELLFYETMAPEGGETVEPLSLDTSLSSPLRLGKLAQTRLNGRCATKFVSMA